MLKMCWFLLWFCLECNILSVTFHFQIITAIFSNLSASTLKTARLVCRLWQSVATPLLGELCVLVPTKMFPCCKSGLTPQVDPKLVKYIRLDNHCRSGNCHMRSNFMEQGDHLFWCTSNSRLVNPSLSTIFRGLAAQHPEHIEQVYFRLVDEPLEYSARWRTRAVSRTKMSSYDFASLPNLKLISIQAPSTKRWGPKNEIKFDRCVPVDDLVEKLYFFPCLVDTDYVFETFVMSTDHLRMLRFAETKLPNMIRKIEKEYDNTVQRTVKEVMFDPYVKDEPRWMRNYVEVSEEEEELVTKVCVLISDQSGFLCFIFHGSFCKFKIYKNQIN